MAWIARDLDGDLFRYDYKPVGLDERYNWIPSEKGSLYMIEYDDDKKLIGRHITWEDEPVEI